MILKKRKTRKSYGHFVYIDETHLAKGDDFDFIWFFLRLFIKLGEMEYKKEYKIKYKK